MKQVMVVAAVVAMAAGTSHAQGADPKVKALEAQVAKLEARVAKLEAENKKYAESLEFLQKVYVQQKQQQDHQDANTPAPDARFAVDIADSVKAGHAAGPAGAAVTIVWAFDLNDRYSAYMQPIVEKLLTTRKDVRVVYKHMIVHPNATLAHKAACAAAKQGKFAAFYRTWWERGFDLSMPQRDPQIFTESGLVALGKKAGLDTKKLKTDMNGTACDEYVKADIAQLTKFRVNATPTFFINGRRSVGRQEAEVFAPQIDTALDDVTKSGVPAAKYYTDVVMVKGDKEFRPATK